MVRFQVSLRLLATVPVLLALAALGARDAAAQVTANQPTLAASVANSYLSVPGAISDMTTKFLRDNANQAGVASYGQGTASPLGGGADAAAGTSSRPSYRFWSEGYGIRSQTGAQNGFTGDHRKTWGGIAGIGMTLPSSSG